MRIPSSIPITSGAIIDEIYANKEFFYVENLSLSVSPHNKTEIVLCSLDPDTTKRFMDLMNKLQALTK